MCPLRIILIFLSATLAGYFAWQSVRSGDNDDLEEETTGGRKKKIRKGFGEVIGDGFWGLVDMASGRYMWRNLVDATERSSSLSGDRSNARNDTFGKMM